MDYSLPGPSVHGIFQARVLEWVAISFSRRGEKVEAMTDFLFLVSKITADGDCSLEIRRCLVFGRKPMTNLDSILKSINVILMAMFLIVRATVFQ